MRDQLARRPLLVATIAFSLGLSSTFVPWHVLLALAFFGLVRDTRSRWIVVIGLALGLFLRPVVPSNPIWEKQPITVTGRISSVPNDAFEGRISLLDTGDRKFLVKTPPEADISIGDVIKVGGQAGPLGEGSGYEHGSVGMLTAVGGVEVLSPGPFLGRWGLAVRDSFRRFVDHTLAAKDAALVDAIGFNVTSDIDQGDYVAMKKSGIVHVISTSGVHVVLVAGFLAWLARKTPMPRPWSLALLALLLVVYACAAGLRPPMVRSVGMALFALSAYLFRREPDGLSSLAAASFVTLLADPWSIVDIGFWLSIVSVGALVLFVDPFTVFEGGRDPRHWFATAWKTGWVVTLATVPVVACFFGQVALAGPVANLIAIPASELLLFASLVAWLCSFVVPVMGQGLLLLSSGPLLSFLRSAAYAGAHFCPGVPSFSAYWCVWFYGIALAFWRPWIRPA